MDKLENMNLIVRCLDVLKADEPFNFVQLPLLPVLFSFFHQGTIKGEESLYLFLEGVEAWKLQS